MDTAEVCRFAEPRSARVSRYIACVACVVASCCLSVGARAGILQPPIANWSDASGKTKGSEPEAATPAAHTSTARLPGPAAATTETPKNATTQDQAEGASAPVSPPTETACAAGEVGHAVSTSPAPAMAPVKGRQSAVRRLLRFQSEGVAPGTFQPILGEEAQRTYQYWLKSFDSPSGGSSSSSTLGMSTRELGLPMANYSSQ